MDFCVKCGSILVPKKAKSGDHAKLILVCGKCGQKIAQTSENEKIKSKTIEHSPKQLVSVIDKENQLSTLLQFRSNVLDVETTHN